MDFESAFIGNEENFKEAFANNANISNFISKIKNFIYYSNVETAIKLRNKNLAGVLWLGHLLERRDANTKVVYLDTNTKTLTKQTLVSLTLVIPITITDDNTSTVHSPDFTKNLSLMGNLMADHSGLHRKDKKTNLHNHKDINEVTPPPKSSDNNTISIQPTTKTAKSRKKQHGEKQKKANKRTPLTVLTTDANGNDIKGQLQSLPPHQSAHEVNMPIPMKGIINIPAAFNLPPTSEVTIPMDVDLIDLNASQSHENEEPKIPHPYGGAHVNPYIQDLKSLSEDTFMFNSSTNSAHDQLADPPDKAAPDDHPIIVSTALDNLRIISDETPLSKSNKDQQSDTLFTLKHSFLPNCQQVFEEIHDNDYETTILPNGNWHTIKKIKNPKAVLDALKSSTTRSSNNTPCMLKMRRTHLSLTMLTDTIEQAVTKLLGSRQFFIKKSGLKPSKNNSDTITVFITVKDLDKCKQLKDIWSIEIDRILYRFVSVHAKDNDIGSRKKFSGEFVGFDHQTTPAAVQEAYTA
ncbi:hypothetical protein RclHR1_00240050 [Rhizophagus clarus]|uniref:Uncharacterized protein n=1 Tax=Rhizophagus clarus TaxID=94130 RepID=A0A2Z6R1L1_9GLOM|nr:hypothetical protein RclHR1_00240050 [Rhizophagus clarus]